MDWLVFALWAVAAVFFGLWLGERKARIYVQNMKIYGTPDVMDKATMVFPTGVEEVVDEATGKKMLRLVRAEDSQPAHDPATVQNGVDFLLDDARARGEQLSIAEATEEALRMLNAEGPEMA